MRNGRPELCSDECAHVWFVEERGLPIGDWVDTESDAWQDKHAPYGEEYCDLCG